MNAALCTKTIDILELLCYTLLIRSCDLKYYEKELVQMKHTLKKISATALAFVLLGVGNIANAKTAKPVYAHAAHVHCCCQGVSVYCKYLADGHYYYSKTSRCCGHVIESGITDHYIY